jgi:hypothetical protein
MGRHRFARVLISGSGAGLAATLIWLIVVLVAPPIPATVGWALTATGAATVVAVLANAADTPSALLAGLLAVASTAAFIFVAVLLLAHWGPDRLIPDITPAALPDWRVRESRAELVDPYVWMLFLGALAATALGVSAVAVRRT